jgi:hypothetical protein
MYSVCQSACLDVDPLERPMCHSLNRFVVRGGVRSNRRISLAASTTYSASSPPALAVLSFHAQRSSATFGKERRIAELLESPLKDTDCSGLVQPKERSKKRKGINCYPRIPVFSKSHPSEESTVK